MPFKKGRKKQGGREKGTPNKRDAQWQLFADYCMGVGLQKFETEMDKLDGSTFVTAMTNLLEFHKPKLSRQDVKGDLNHNINIIQEEYVPPKDDSKT